MAVEVRDAPDQERFEILVDGELAGFSAYRGEHGDTVALTHTEIDPAFEGQGLGGELVSQVLEALRERGKLVLPICPFVKAYLAEHPDQLDLVDPAIRRAFGLPEPATT